MKRARFYATVAVAAAAACASEQDGRIWNGVYTATQAARGKARFEESCSNCHNSDLNGSVRGPALHGDRFFKDWENTSANVLFVKLRDTMPATYPDAVSEEVKLDILAYLLQTNGFPAGNTELKLDRKELDEILIVRKGEQAAPNFSLVRVVGCLAPGAGKYWTLTRATEPSVIRDETPTTADLKDAAAKPLGADAFELLGTFPFQPDSHKGQKMEARGLLYRDSAKNLLNLTSLATTGADCVN